jgi:hypothetical protein
MDGPILLPPAKLDRLAELVPRQNQVADFQVFDVPRLIDDTTILPTSLDTVE